MYHKLKMLKIKISVALAITDDLSTCGKKSVVSMFAFIAANGVLMLVTAGKLQNVYRYTKVLSGSNNFCLCPLDVLQLHWMYFTYCTTIYPSSSGKRDDGELSPGEFPLAHFV